MTTNSTSSEPEPAQLNALAGLCAFLLPGLGHAVRGERLRGLLAGTAVLSLFFGGMLIGGIDVIDSKEDRVWFIGQGIVGPVAFGVDWVHQNKLKAYGPATTGRQANQIVLRSGQPDETRELDTATGRWTWRRLTREEIQAGVLGPPNRKSVAKDNEIGTLYATLAGMVNFIIILDALIVTPRRRREEVVQPEGASDA
ncbi:MAG: hypothetical protein ACI89L_001240 [Phycisphaerales bacterium]